jgi:hypothetical protein
MCYCRTRGVLLCISLAAAGHDVYVSHNGHDVDGCGEQANGCATIRYAIQHSTTSTNSRDLTVFINGTGGTPYTQEGDVDYINVTHRLQLIGIGNQEAVIQCADNNRTKLFHVDGSSHSAEKLKTSVSLSMQVGT